MDKIISVVEVGEPIPSLENKLNTYREEIYEMQKSDGNIYRLLKSQYKSKEEEEKSALTERSKKKLRRYKRKKLFVNQEEYWEFINYLAKCGRIGGFQCVKDKEEQLKIDYFNATGEELEKDQYNPNLSSATYGNAMRVYFLLPNNLSINELNNLLPGDIIAKKWADGSNEYCISRMPFVLELLSMGFRYGTNHKLDEIEKSISQIR